MPGQIPYFHLQIVIQEEFAQPEVPVNNLVWVRVLAAEDHVLQVAADLGLGLRLPPPVWLQGNLRRQQCPSTTSIKFVSTCTYDSVLEGERGMNRHLQGHLLLPLRPEQPRLRQHLAAKRLLGVLILSEISKLLAKPPLPQEAAGQAAPPTARLH